MDDDGHRFEWVVDHLYKIMYGNLERQPIPHIPITKKMLGSLSIYSIGIGIFNIKTYFLCFTYSFSIKPT